MLFRFALYGFLKNQRYFEPFLILALRARGLSFAGIGLLIGFREICINLMEIPSGAVADVAGRRKCMVLSFLAYIGSFLIFAWAGSVWSLLGAMLLFATGEAFRTGTHKAIIFDWLARQGRRAEKTRVYGFTRSWSKLGSAVSVLIAAALVFTIEVEQYRWVFLLSILPYAVNVGNFLTYPRALDGPGGGRFSVRRVAATTWAGFRRAMRHRPLRGVLVESMAYEGVYKSTKDYIQPLLKAAAVGLPVLLALGDRQRTALLVGSVYAVLYAAGSFASRHAHALSRRAGSDVRGALWVLAMTSAAFLVMGAGLLLGAAGVAVAAFVALAVFQNFWRPIIVGRVADQADEAQAATVLSIDSQGKSVVAAAIAPLLGLAVDLAGRGAGRTMRFAPVAAVGLVVTLGMLIHARRALRREQSPEPPADTAQGA
ncbi:MAG: MFS transporter [Planctomycetota bacterium]